MKYQFILNAFEKTWQMFSNCRCLETIVYVNKVEPGGTTVSTQHLYNVSSWYGGEIDFFVLRVLVIMLETEYM